MRRVPRDAFKVRQEDADDHDREQADRPLEGVEFDPPCQDRVRAQDPVQEEEEEAKARAEADVPQEGRVL